MDSPSRNTTDDTAAAARLGHVAAVKMRSMGTLDWAGAANVRDIGGLPLAGGGSTASGVIIRSGALDGLTTAGRDQVLALQPSRIIDLRSSHEITQPSPLAGLHQFRQLPFVDPARDAEREPATERSRSDLYRGSLYRNGKHVARIWTEIAEADAGPVIIYCRSGVDRTGMMVALLLSVAGVDHKRIGEDYALDTGATSQPATLSSSQQNTRRPAWAMGPPQDQTMIDVLDWLNTDYGGAAGYLTSHGVTNGHVAAVKRRLTDHAHSTSESSAFQS